MRFTDVAGSIQLDVSHLKTFVESWYDEGDNIVVVGMPVEGARRVMSQALSRERILSLTNEDLDGLTKIGDDGRKVNTYIGINPVKDPEAVTLYSRGTEDNVMSVYGCFIDFDINKEGKKSGVFDSKEDILSFIDSLDLEPTIVVDNGESGGIHAYWRFEDVYTGVDRDKYKPLLTGWWAYIQSKTDKHIDRLIDVTRISRLPSGIYWPSAGEKFDTVKVIRSSGVRHSRDSILNLSGPSYEAHKKRLENLRIEKTSNLDFSVRQFVVSGAEGELLQKIVDLRPSNRNMVLTLVEQHINHTFLWRDILEPHGWTFLKDGPDGEEVWSRPGKSDRSAVVNHMKHTGEVSVVMSLLSSSPETGLADLKEAGVDLTKMQVLLRLSYEDDVVSMLTDITRKAKL